MYLYVILDVRKEAYDAHPSLCLSRVTVNDGKGMRMYDLCSFSCMDFFLNVIVGHSCKTGNVRYGGTSKTQN